MTKSFRDSILDGTRHLTPESVLKSNLNGSSWHMVYWTDLFWYLLVIITHLQQWCSMWYIRQKCSEGNTQAIKAWIFM